MKILVVGGGAREHAVVSKLSQSRHITEIYASPGNAGIAEIAECVDFSPHTIDALVDFAKYEWIDLTLVFDQRFISQDIAGAFKREGRPIFAAGSDAARICSSRLFARDIMRRHRLPMPGYRPFASYLHAEDYVRMKGAPVIIKTDERGEYERTVIAPTVEEAVEVLRLIMNERVLGDMGQKIFIEDYLPGEKISLVAVTDGIGFLPVSHLVVSRSPAEPGKFFYTDEGGYSPAECLSTEKGKAVFDGIMGGVVKALRAEGMRYSGFITADVMVDGDKLHLVELYLGLGSLAAQILLPRLETDFAEILMAATGERLPDTGIGLTSDASVCIMLSSAERGRRTEIPISGLEKVKALEKTFVFHENTVFADSRISAQPGKTLGVVALGSNTATAKARAYEAAGKIHFEGIHYKRDIGENIPVRL